MSYDDDDNGDGNGHSKREPSAFTWRDRERLLRLNLEMQGVKIALGNMDRSMQQLARSEDLIRLEKKMERDYVSFWRYRPVEMLIYGFVAIALAGIVIALVASVIPGFKVTL